MSTATPITPWTRPAARKLGLPRIDKAIYPSDNGFAISALADYYDATGDAIALQAAVDAAKWIKSRRALDGGGFRHSDSERGGPFLADSLAMGQAFIDLYAATGTGTGCGTRRVAGDFIGAHFKDNSSGFIAFPQNSGMSGVFARPVRQLDDQFAVARFMNLLHRYTGKAQYGDSRNMRCVTPSPRNKMKAQDLDRPAPGLLLADLELGHAPTHITIVGPKEDALARQLAAAARALPATYKRLDWWDRREGPLDNPDITYPEMDRPAAFACGDRICSLPAFTAEELKRAVQRMAMLAQGKSAPAAR